MAFGIGRALKKAGRKLDRGTRSFVSKAVKNPATALNPGLYLGGASIAGPGAAALGKSGSKYADKGGTVASVGGSAAAVVVAGGAYVGAAGASVPSLATVTGTVGAAERLKNLTGADASSSYTAEGSGTGDVTAGAPLDDAGEGFNFENAALVAPVVALGIVLVVLSLKK